MRLSPASRLRPGHILAALLLLPLGACSSSHLGAKALLDNAVAPGGIPITVDNANYHDMRIYALLGSTAYPLGTVRSAETRTFVVPGPILGVSGAVQLRAELLGSRESFTSPWISAGPDDRVEWRLASAIKLSTFAVR